MGGDSIHCVGRKAGEQVCDDIIFFGNGGYGGNQFRDVGQLAPLLVSVTFGYTVEGSLERRVVHYQQTLAAFDEVPEVAD